MTTTGVHRAVSALLALTMVVTASCTSGDRAAAPEDFRKAPLIAPQAHYTPSTVERVNRPARGWMASACGLPLEYLRRIRRGYFPGRSPDVVVVPREPNFFGAFFGQSHSGPWDYLQQVPLVFYGPGYIRARGEVSLNREVTVADIAPTIAELVGAETPQSAGVALDEVIVPQRERATPPKLVLTVVWDGGGVNVLEAWPDAWPELRRLMDEGSAVRGATVGSSPSVTPAVHATIGTGEWPKRHGLTGIPFRLGDRMRHAFGGKSPQHLMTPTLADTYDAATGNAAKIGLLAFKSWHLGMIGHGALIPGGDRDVAVIVNQSERLATNRQAYSLPIGLRRTPGLQRSIREVDLDDGKLDEEWMGHDILDDRALRRDTPVWTLHQTTLVERLLRLESFGRDEVPDLFYTNYKQPDEVGHNWNMLYPEMKPTLEYTDAALGHLKRFLNIWVGPRRWVMIVTADHGQGPLAEAAHAWPIRTGVLVADMAAHFGVGAADLIQETSPVGFWFRPEVLASEGITLEEVSDWLIDYRLEDNLTGGERIPDQYRSRLQEPVLTAAFPSRSLGAIWGCARRARG